MSSSRNINTSLFVTVISAYLGLLIVGVPVEATAQQLAKKADFIEEVNCSDEPTPEVKGLLSVHAFTQPIFRFVADVSRIISIGKDDFDEKYSEQFEVSVTHQPLTEIKVNGAVNNIKVKHAAERAAGNIDLEFNFHPLSLHDSPKSTVSNFLLDDSGLTITSKFSSLSSDQAQQLAAIYNSYLSFGRCREKGQPDEVLYQNTKALADNNQVLIVTHLPRAALSDLLARQVRGKLSR